MLNKSNVVPCAGIIIFLILFFYPSDFMRGAATGLKNSASIIVPSLFPSMVAASLLAQGRTPRLLKKYIEPLTQRLFAQPADCLVAVISGLFGGYPSGARAAAALCDNGIISENCAKRLMLFCVNAGTGFCVNALGVSLLHSKRAGVIIFVSLVVSALITGLFTKAENAYRATATISEKSASAAFVSSVASGASGIITVCAFSVLFSGLIAVISKMITDSRIITIISCLLEITSGCTSAAGKIPLPLICAACAFGGVCVHLQIFAVAGEHKPDILKFYLFRLAHAALAGVVCKVLIYFFPVSVTTSLQLSQNAQAYSFSLPAALSLLFFSSLLILELDKQRKIC